MGILRHRSPCARPDQVDPPAGRPRLIKLTATGIALALAAGLAPSAVDAEPLSGADGSTLQREPLQTPDTLGDGAVDGLQYADPTEGLSIVSPPEASAGGSAQASYPILIPPGRGITPDLALTYDSGGGNGWTGLGWDLSVGEISVDTSWGAPHFDPSFESETYLLDGQMLVPNGLGETWQARQRGDRQDYTLQVESEYLQIIRHEVDEGGPDDYYWEVRDKKGNVKWYGGHPDRGGPAEGLLKDGNGNDLTIDRSAIVYDEKGNAVKWLLSAERDVGVNMMRYTYRTISYKRNGGVWSREACTSSSTNLCARHTYLSRIDYTGGADASGEPEDPAYQVHFRLESDLNPSATRPDPTIDGVGGYLDLVNERLARIDVLWGPPKLVGGQRVSRTVYDQIAARYDLTYQSGPFGKSLLASVKQVDPVDATKTATHTFTYFDEVRTAGGGYDGFAAPDTWTTGEDLAGRLLLDSTVDIGALGSSETNSAEGHAYIGFNPAIPQKVGSFGGSIQIGGGKTEAISEWIDLNGDSLPDKVFRDGGSVKYRLNEGRPKGFSKTFSKPDDNTVSGISSLSSESNIGFQFSIEAHLVVTAAFGLGADFTWGDAYFTDVNSDGLPDFVSGGQVYFNRLVNGKPTFLTTSTGTPVPLPDTASPDISVPQLDELEDDLAAQSPLVDTVRRWIAPFTGTVSIQAPVTLAPAATSKDGVRVAIQQNNSEISSDILTASGAQAFTTAISRSVSRGDRLYFRVGSRDDGANDEVTWSPQITYTAINGVANVATVPLDVNGLSQTAYSASTDFTLSGRPNTEVAMPLQGTVRFQATVTKSKVTTDDLQLVLLHNGAAVPGSNVTIAAGFIGSQDLLFDFPVARPVLPDANNPNIEPSNDTVHVHLGVDSPIDLNAVSWQPSLHYLTAVDRNGNPVQTFKNGQPTIQVDLTPEIDQYPNRSSTGISTAWVAGSGGTYDARITFGRNDTDGGTAILSVKSAAGALLLQQPFNIPAGSGSFEAVLDTNLAIASGSGYYFDLSIRDPGLSATVSLSSMVLRPDGAANGDNDVSVPATLHWTGSQSIFPLAYRGWAVAGYTANGNLATSAIQESAFDINPDELPDQPQAPDGFDDLGDDPPEPDRAFAYLPVARPKTVEGQAVPLTGPQWQGSRTNLAASATRTRSSRSGSDTVDVSGTGGSGRAVTRVGVTGPSAALAFGLGPLGASFGVGPSFGLVDYEDMNGDGYPDVITPGKIQYTKPRGDFRTAADSVGNMDVSNQDLTFSVSGGFSSGLVDIKGNTKGKANATQGSAAGKGDEANDSGGGLGIGLDVNASWTSPNASGPSSAPLLPNGTADPSTKYGDQLSEVPSDSSGAGAPIQQALADVNGDGLPDRVYTTPAGVFARYNLGYGFTQAAVPLSTGGFESQESYAGGLSLGFATPWGEFSGGVALNWNYDLARYSWRDVNGDGILDRVHKINDSSPPAVAFGTGSGVLAPVTYGQMEKGSKIGAIDVGQQVSFDRSNSLGGGFDFTIYVGPLCLVACYLVINPGASYQNSVSSTEVDLQDVNGDGYADSVSTTDDDVLVVRLNKQGKTNLLKKVANPLGGSFELDYERDGNTVEHPDSLWALSKVSVNDGRPGDGVDVTVTTYEYSGLRYDRLHRQSMGYATVVENELNSTGTLARKTTRQFLNANVFVAGLETALTVTDPAGKKLRGTAWTWGFRDVRQAITDIHAVVNPSTAFGQEPKSTIESLGYSIAPLLTRLEETVYDTSENPGQVSRMDFTYDGLGNVVKQLDWGEIEDANDDLLATFTYSTCTISSSTGPDGLGCFGDAVPTPTRVSPIYDEDLCPTWVSLPAVFKITNGKANGSEVVYRERDGRRQICDNASVTKLEESVNGGPKALTELTYDSWGSYDRIVYPRGADGRRYAVWYVWDEDRHSNVAEVHEYDLTGERDEDEDPELVPPNPRDQVTEFLSDNWDGTFVKHTPLKEGLYSSAEFDPLSGRPSKRTDANGHETRYAYDSFGRIVSISSPRPSDPQPLVTYEYFPTATGYAHAVAKHYDAFNAGDTIDTVTFVDGIGRTTQTKRDARLATGGGQASDGRIVSGKLEYDALGRVVTEHQPTRDTKTDARTFENSAPVTPATATEYDLYDQPTKVTEPGTPDRVTTLAYQYGQVANAGPTLFKTTVTNPKSRKTITYTDVRDVVRAVEDQPSGVAVQRTTYAYDGMGQLRGVVDIAGNQTTHTYDVGGRLTSTTTPDGGKVDYTYDTEGKLVTKVTPNLRALNQKVEYSYELGRLVKVDYPNGTPDVTYTYGEMGAPNFGAGRVVRSEDGARIVENEYAPSGDVVKQTAEMKVHRWDNPDTDRDELTWVTEWTYDGLGRLESMVYPDGEELTYDYDAGGLVREIKGKEDGFRRVLVGYDAEGNPIYEDQPTTWFYDYLLDRQYDVFLRRAHEQLGNGATTTLAYDPKTQWLTSLRTVSPNRDVTDPAYQEIQDLKYTYDAIGNPLTYANDLPAPVSNLFGGPTAQRYTYDAYDRLIGGSGEWQQAVDKQRRHTFSVTYDVNGNVVTKNQRDVLRNGNKDLVQKDTTYSFTRRYGKPAPHQAAGVGTDTYHYDANGNFLGIKDRRGKWVREVTWDATDRMRSVTDGPSRTDYTYDGTGQRTIERGPAGETAFVNPWVTMRNTNEMFKHIWASDERIATQRDDGPYEEVKRYFLHKDLQGSTNIVTDYSGETFQHHEYFPTGEVWVDEKSTVFRTPYQYAGGYVDEVRQIISIGARWYDQDREMFYSADPILTDDPTAMIDQPDLRAAYSYAGANPQRYVDPSGLQFILTQNQVNRAKNTYGPRRATVKQMPFLAGMIEARLKTRLPKSFVRMGLDIERADRRQALADRWAAKPLIEVNVSEGTVKFSLGMGKRLKLPRDKAAPAPTNQNQQPPAANTGATGPSGGPNVGSQGAPGGNTSPQAPPPPSGQASGQASTGKITKPLPPVPGPRPPKKPLPPIPVKQPGQQDARADQ